MNYDIYKYSGTSVAESKSKEEIERSSFSGFVLDVSLYKKSFVKKIVYRVIKKKE